MPRDYYSAKFRLDGRVAYFLWSTQSEIDADLDEIWVQNGVAPCFKYQAALERFAHEGLGIQLPRKEPLLHRLNDVTRWLKLKKSKRSRQLPSGEILSAWNLFADLARALKVTFRGDAQEINPLYDKIFWSSNLPTLTPPRKRFLPRWSAQEIYDLREVLNEGFLLWRAHVHYL